MAFPDPALTPGDVLSVGADQICVSGYSSRVRNVSAATKDAAYAEYHIATRTAGQYEVDHLIPLELGGSNDLKNLWPEPAEPPRNSSGTRVSRRTATSLETCLRSTMMWQWRCISSCMGH